MTRPMLRPYQRACISSVWDWMRKSVGNPLLVVPTGGGKSLIGSALIAEACESWPGTRILLLSHVKELLAQNGAALLSYWPQAPLAYYSAGLGAKRIAQITIAGIQSVYKHALKIGHVDLVIIDEAHLVSPKDTTQYRVLLAALQEINPSMRVVGMTATPYRLDSGLLTEGDTRMFHDIAYSCDIGKLIADGYLCPLVPKPGQTKADLSAVRTRGGDFMPSDLAYAVDKADLVEGALDEVEAYASDRHHWLLFCVDVKHSEHVRDSLVRRGIAAGCITGETPKEERARTIADFKAGRLRAITNCDVLTTGFDAPMIDCIIMLRPTKSIGLYVQICGRGFRRHESKTDTLVLDFAGNVARHGPVDKIRIRSKWEKRAEGDGPLEVMPMKECPECHMLAPIAARKCECGYEFPFDKAMHGTEADSADIVAALAKPKDFAVEHVSYARHEKAGKPASLKVSYVVAGGLLTYSEWVCIEHDGYARKNAGKWFGRRGMMCPHTVDEALLLASLNRIPAPVQITVRTEGKYDRIIGEKLDLNIVQAAA
jgi:DNA repair protein RadD